MGSTENIHTSEDGLAKTIAIVAAPLECEVTVVEGPTGRESAQPRGHDEEDSV